MLGPALFDFPIFDVQAGNPLKLADVYGVNYDYPGASNGGY